MQNPNLVILTRKNTFRFWVCRNGFLLDAIPTAISDNDKLQIMKVSLNPQYGIRNERNCSYLVKVERLDNRIEKQIFEDIESILPLPPFLGYLLSQFKGEDAEDTIGAICLKLKISDKKIRGFISALVDNPSSMSVKLLSGDIVFPPFVLTSRQSSRSARVVTLPGFHPSDQFILKRPDFPLFITLMITSKCRTDCIYCYADRSGKNDVGTELILKTIDEAYEEGVMYFNVSGGDIFSLKSWRTVLKKLTGYGFFPFISTKIPLGYDDVVFLKEIGVKNIQFSMDSFYPEEIKKNIKRKGTYVDEVKNTFCYLQESGIRLGVRSVVTKHNSSISSIKNTLEVLENYKDILDNWDITPAFFSEFQGQYDSYEPRDSDIATILAFINSTNTDLNIDKKNLIDKLTYKTVQYEDEYQFICKNKSCIANTYSMFIISNGKATLCELMYYNTDFYTGDIKKNSLKEIWTSEMSLKLFTPRKEDIIDTRNNPCYSCGSFEECKTKNGKSICYVDIIRVYGAERFQYPDPRCPKAPDHDKSLLLF